MKKAKVLLPLVMAAGFLGLCFMGASAASPDPGSTQAPPAPVVRVTPDPLPPENCVPVNGYLCQPSDDTGAPQDRLQPGSFETLATEYAWQKAVAWYFIRQQQDMYMFSDSDAWTVGGGGDVLRWNGSALQYYGVPGVTTGMNAIDMLSQSDGWIVGDQGVILHWNGTSWNKFTSPTTLTLREIDMLSANDGWIVGGDSPNNLLLRWNGSAWNTVVAPPGSGGNLMDVEMLTPANGWIVGALPGTLLHWDGSAWQSVTSPTNGALNAVDMVSATDGWAVGNAGSSSTGVVLHWNGSDWQSVTIPGGVAELEEISMASANDGWATPGSAWYLIHWDGTAWTKESTPGAMHSIQMFSATNGWGVGGSLYHYTVFNGIKIHVVRADGQPSVGAQVKLLPKDGSSLENGSAWTDDLGNTAISAPPGTYHLQAVSSSDHILLTSLNVTVPSSVTLSAAGQPLITLTAKKRDGTTPLDQAKISIGLSGQQGILNASSMGQVNASGQLAFSVSPGTYDVDVSDATSRYYLVKGQVAIIGNTSLVFNASSDPTSDLVISHPGMPTASVWVDSPELNLSGGNLGDMAEGSQAVLSGNQEFSVYQKIAKTAANGDIWEYVLEGPLTLLPAGETLASTVGGALSAHMRQEPAFPGTTIPLTFGFFDAHDNEVSWITRRTPPATYFQIINPQVELFDPQNNLLKQDSSYVYSLPASAALGTYKAYYWQDTGPYQGNYGTMGSFDVELPSVSADIPTSGGELTSTFDSSSYLFQAGTFSQPVTITHTTTFIPVSSFSLGSIGHNFNITAIYTTGGLPAQPLKAYKITILYTHDEIGATVEDTLALYYWDGDEWVKEPTSMVDTFANKIVATPDHFSGWAVMGETWRVYLPLVRR